MTFLFVMLSVSHDHFDPISKRQPFGPPLPGVVSSSANYRVLEYNKHSLLVSCIQFDYDGFLSRDINARKCEILLHERKNICQRPLEGSDL
jgi:hypothetical protein